MAASAHRQTTRRRRAATGLRTGLRTARAARHQGPRAPHAQPVPHTRPPSPADDAHYEPSRHPGRAERAVIRSPGDDLLSNPAHLDMSAEASEALGAAHAAPAAPAATV